MADGYVLFLRGMNLGGRRITNDRLVEAVIGLGYPRALAYQASGNVLLPSAPTPDADQLAIGLAAALGYDVPCLLRSAADIDRLVGWEAFAPDELASGGKPQVIMLSRPAGPDDIEAWGDGLDDHLRVSDDGLDLAWLPRAGLSDSELDLAAINRSHGPSTVRTLGTLQRLARRLVAAWA